MALWNAIGGLIRIPNCDLISKDCMKLYLLPPGFWTPLFTGWLLAGPLAAVSSAVTLFASDGTNLARFDSATPGSLTVTPITGLTAGHTVIGMDSNNSSGQIYIHAGPNTTPTGSPNSPEGINVFGLWDLNPSTGSASRIGSGGYYSTLGSAAMVIGYDYDPVRNLLRSVWSAVNNTSSALNLTLNLQGEAGQIGYPPFGLNGGAPLGTLVGGAAVAQNGSMYLIGSSGSLMFFNGTIDTFPTTTTVGSLGLGSTLDHRMGFDIYHPSGEAFASISIAGVTSLYAINLATGAATNRGTIGDGTVAYSHLTAVPEPTGPALGLMGLLGWFLKRRRQLKD